MRLLLIAAAGFTLAGCHVQTKGREAAGSDDDNVTISGTGNGSMSFDVPFAKGQINLPEGAMAHGNVDIDGVKLYPGSKVDGFHVQATNGKSQVNIRFTAPGSPDQVRAYFLDQFKAKHVDASASGSGITGKSEDGDQFQIGLQPAQSGTAGTVTIDGKSDDD